MIENFASARPYVKAIFTLAKEQNKLNEWNDILDLLSVLAKDASVINLLKNPRVEYAKQWDFLASVSTQLLQNNQLSVTPEVMQLLQLLLMKRKIELLPTIANLYKKSLAKFEGIFPAKVVSALPLNVSMQNALKNSLQEKYGFKVTLEFKVDPQIIGGVIINVNDQVIDGSVLGQMQRLQQYING